MTEQARDFRDELGALALAAADAGANAIGETLRQGPLAVSGKSASHDLVTSADRASELAVLSVLRDARPDDAVQAEESGASPGTSGVRWLVDPLDGTANFVYGRPDYAVSVGAAVDGQLTVGAIVSPADGRWVATTADSLRAGTRRTIDSRRHAAGRPIIANGGRGGVPRGLTSPASAAEALVSFGLPYDLEQRQRVVHLIAALVPSVRGVRVVGSAARDFLALVHGEADASVTVGLAEWDVAAGLAATTSAGGAWRRVPVREGLEALVAGAQAVVDELSHLLERRVARDER